MHDLFGKPQIQGQEGSRRQDYQDYQEGHTHGPQDVMQLDSGQNKSKHALISWDKTTC